MFLGNGTADEVNFRIILVFFVTNVIFVLANTDWNELGDHTLHSLWQGFKGALSSVSYWLVIVAESCGKYYILLPLNNYNKPKCR